MLSLSGAVRPWNKNFLYRECKRRHPVLDNAFFPGLFVYLCDIFSITFYNCFYKYVSNANNLFLVTTTKNYDNNY